MEHELTAVPPALYHDDVGMRKSNKADLEQKIEATCEEVHILPHITGQSIYIIDGMAFLQCQNEALFQTFDDLGNIIFAHIKSVITGPLGTDTIVLVFYCYDVRHSIKQFERARRGTADDGTAASHKITGKHSSQLSHVFEKLW